jgi:hypothetical protein
MVRSGSAHDVDGVVSAQRAGSSNRIVTEKGALMASVTTTRSSSWGGWIAFAGWLMIVIATLDFFEGLIAIIRGQYYVLSANQIIVFDVRTWGWVTMIWAVVLALAGLGVLAGSGWARWFAIVVGSLNFIAQLGFVGSTQYPLWALTVLALTGIALFALIVHWHDAETY